MKCTKTLMITLVLLVASTGSAQVVLPASSDYNNPYNYFRDCVDRNGEEHEGVCEQQASALFSETETETETETEAEAETESESDGNSDLYALSNDYQQD